MKHYIDTEGNLFAFEADGSQDHLIPSNYKAVTNEEADSIVQKHLKTQFDSLNYAQKRSNEYPSITDQLDALYHAGMFPSDMAARIKAVKDKYPKK